LDRAVTEAELRDVFGKTAKVTRVNIPQTMAGVNKGFAFLDFETKEEAQKAAAELNNVKLRRQIITVDVSKENKVKPSAKMIDSSRDSASPAPLAQDAGGNHPMKHEHDPSTTKASTSDVEARTMALFGLPDTVNDARVQNLAERFGKVVKLVLQPGHGSARIEFEDVATAGQAGMALNGYDFEGQKLLTGSLDDLRRLKPLGAGEGKQNGLNEQRSSGAISASKGLMMPTSVRRPALKKSAPRRGAAPMRRVQIGSASATGGSAPAQDSQTKPKSNADFKAMFLSQGKQGGGQDQGKDDAN
jgi:RNA recognition motif-containing protein